MSTDNSEIKQFWKLRSKHGRDTLFSSGELLWEAACEYFAWIDDNPWETRKNSAGPKGDTEEIEQRKIPYTLEGLCRYLNCNTNYFREFKLNMKRKLIKNFDEDMYKSFSAAVSEIEDVIREQKYTGAASGFFNASIISRDLGLAEKVQAETINFNHNTNLTKDEVKQIAKDLEDEY